jgi:hypothetical protein
MAGAFRRPFVLYLGTATVPVASSRRPADWLRRQYNSPFSEASQGPEAFGETPKAADEDVRAPQSI